jgi:hypothetical protein
MKPVASGGVTDILPITSNTGTLLVITSGLGIIMTAYASRRLDW